MLQDVAGGSQQKTAGARGGIDDGEARSRPHRIHDGIDQDARREILAGAGLGILRVLFEQAFVDVAFDVGRERAPRLLVDEIDDEAAQVGGVLNLVLGLAENDAENSRLLAEIVEGIAVVSLERQAIERHQFGPVVLGGDGGLLLVWWACALIVHLEEEKIRELLDVVAVRDPVVAKEVAVVPDFVDEIGSGGGHSGGLSRGDHREFGEDFEIRRIECVDSDLIRLHRSRSRKSNTSRPVTGWRCNKAIQPERPEQVWEVNVCQAAQVKPKSRRAPLPGNAGEQPAGDL